MTRTCPSDLAPWEVGFGEPPTADQFALWLSTEPAFESWVKIHKDSAETKSRKALKK
jgi:hypothetical protein